MKEKIKRIGIVNAVTTVLFLVFQYLIYFVVRFSVDDCMYVHFSKDILKCNWYFYNVGNGRWIINLADSLLMKLDKYGLILMDPVLLVVLAFMIYKLISKFTACDSKVYTCVLISFAAISLFMSQETFYWLAASVTYIFSSIMFVGFLLAFLRLRNDKELSKGKRALLFLVCFITTCSIEQFALVHVGFLLVVLIYDFIKKRKVEWQFVLLFVLCVVAMATVVFAPANFVRLHNNAINADNNGLTGMVSAVMDAMFFVYHSSSAMRFIAALCALEMFVLIKYKKRFFFALNCVEAVIIILLSFLNFANIVLAAFGLVLFLVITFYVLRIAEPDGRKLVCVNSLFVMSILSQAFFLIGNYHNESCYRISLPIILSYIIIIAYLSAKLNSLKALLTAFSVILLFINLYAGAAACVIAVVLLIACKNDKVNNLFLLIVSAAVICFSLIPNYLVMEQIAKVCDFNEKVLTSGEKNVIIYKFENNPMGINYFSASLVMEDERFLIPDIERQTFCYDFNGSLLREYYGIPNDVEFTYVEIGDVSELPE